MYDKPLQLYLPVVGEVHVLFLLSLGLLLRVSRVSVCLIIYYRSALWDRVVSGGRKRK